MKPEYRGNRSELDDQALAGVSGGAGASDFARMADSCAWAYGCINCPHRNIYSIRGMCAEVYDELLANFVMDKPAGERCPRRK